MIYSAPNARFLNPLTWFFRSIFADDFYRIEIFIPSSAIMSLTQNAVRSMFSMTASGDNPSFSPTVQVIHLKKIDNKGGGQEERWKVRFLILISLLPYLYL